MTTRQSLASFTAPVRPVAWTIVPLAPLLLILEEVVGTFIASLAVMAAFWVLARRVTSARSVRVPHIRWLTGALTMSLLTAAVSGLAYTAWTAFRILPDPLASSPYVPLGTGDPATAGILAGTFAVVAVVILACAWAGIALGVIHARFGGYAAAATLIGCCVVLLAAVIAIPDDLNPGRSMDAPVPAVFVFLLPLAAAGFIVTAALTRRIR